MKPYFSIVIPYHNSQSTIGKLLASLAQSKRAPSFEVIIADDGSKQPIDTLNIRRAFKFPVKTVRFAVNRGPAAARNAGAARARGQYLIFMDSDVEVFPDTLYQIAKIFTMDPDVVALAGVWTKSQRSKAFFPNFKALRDWSYWINEREAGAYYYIFSTRIAAIKEPVFRRLGGFDESYKAALVEDIELTYRIARRYAVLFEPRVRVRHEFEGFWRVAVKYFWRSYHWVLLYQDRKKFDLVATTSKEAAAAVSAVVLVVLIPLRLLSYITLPHAFLCYFIPVFDINICFGSLLQGLLLATAILHLYFVRKFLLFVAREKGIWFAVRSFFVGIALYCFITAGALWAKIPISRLLPHW